MKDDRNLETLLDDLRLDRAAPQMRRGVTRFRLALLVLTIALVVAGLVAGYFYFSTVREAVAVRVVEVMVTEPSATSLEASGYVVALQAATISAKIMGKLVSLEVAEGDRVEAGQIIARLDDTNILAALHVAQAQERQAMASVAEAETAFADVTPSYRRYQALIESGVISKEAFERVQASYNAARMAVAVAREKRDVAKAATLVAQANEDDTIVRAPFAGVVTAKSAQLGEIIAPAAAGGGFTRTGILTIVDMSSLVVEVDVSENNINQLHLGQRASVTLNAYEGWTIPAVLGAIIPTADESKGTIKVRVLLQTNGDQRILPHMGARVSFLRDGAVAQTQVTDVVVPGEAVILSRQQAFVWIVQPDNTITRRTVTLGARQGTGFRIHSGLHAGDHVAAGDLTKLHDGARISIQASPPR
jgi:RND family efflux transporter MFP subunit